MNGRTKIAIKNKISDYIPNPTFNKVAPPGAQELEFKLKNPDSMTKADKEAQLPPPKYIEAPPAFFEPEARAVLMDEQGIDRAMMWPTLASLLEERLTDDPVATHAVVHALNQWMHEQWTFNFENRIFPTPVITLPIVDKAIEELEWVVERGAKAILVRPAPVPDFGGRRRSFALPEFDPFWKLVEEADVAVGMHASDSGYQRYINEWEGHDGEFLPFNRKLSGFYELLHAENRMINDVVSSIIGHGLATRFPKLRFMPVENGSAWVRPLVDGMQKVYARTPEVFDEDPMEAFKRLHLRAPVPRGGPDRPGRAHRRRQRAVRVGLPAPRRHVRPDQLRRPARRPPRGRQGQGHGRQPQPHHEGRGLTRRPARQRTSTASVLVSRPLVVGLAAGVTLDAIHEHEHRGRFRGHV